MAYTTRRFYVLPALFLMSVIVATGCQRAPFWAGTSKGPSNTTPLLAGQLNLCPQDMFGTYVVTDCAEYRGSLNETRKWANAQVGREMIISPDVCMLIESSVAHPLYRVKAFAELPVGEVPHGERRLLSDFNGFGAERHMVTVLDVFGSRLDKDKDIFDRFEIIDKDTLWFATDGWFFQLRRKGAGAPVPLAMRRS